MYPVATTKNSKHPGFDNSDVMIPYAMSGAKVRDIFDLVQDKNYVKMRPVASFPTLSERDILC